MGCASRNRVTRYNAFIALVAAIPLLSGAVHVGCGSHVGEIPPPTGDRVLLIGVDALTWDVMRPLIASGRLPTFARLVAEGWSGTLRSLEPTLSPRIWTTIATGKSPEEHGITGFLARAPDGAEKVPVTSNLRRSEALWTISSRHGRTVNVVGWYVTWPAEQVNGVMVSDRFVPEGPLAGGDAFLTAEHPGVSPTTLAPTLRALFVPADDLLNPFERDFHRQYRAYPVDATRTAIAEHLLKERPTDLTLVYLWGADTIQHLFWKHYQPETWLGPPIDPLELAMNREKIPMYHEDIDGFVKRLLAGMDPRTTVLIVSDHGFGPATTYDPQSQINGDHRPDGIIIAAGNHVRRGVAESVASVLDVAPTVLYLLGLPTGEDMEGRVIRDLVEPAFFESSPPRMISTYEQGQSRAPETPVVSPMDEAIKERLRKLGYIK
jgi:predicted AlkP superfamily phosphohydrolase/phosphomutase